MLSFLFSVPEVNLSAMSGYLAPSNIAETQFDDDETGIRRRAGQRRKLHSVLFFQRLRKRVVGGRLNSRYVYIKSHVTLHVKSKA